jgi:transmembrane sensor
MTKRGKHSENRDQYRKQLDTMWDVFDSVPQPTDDLEGRIFSETTDISHVSPGQSSTFSWVYRAAAAVLLLLGVGVLLYYISQNDVSHITSISYKTTIHTTDRGEIIELHLSDHIYVQLNAQTELQVVSDGDEISPKLVFLNGEAYFNISQAPEGFAVTTHAGIVEVVGTAFNVRAREEEVEVAVESGLVTLRGLPDEDVETVVRVPSGHRSMRQKNAPAIEPMPVDIDRYLSWRIGRFVFEQTPLSDVIINLERAYNVRIDLHHTDLEDIRVTGEFGQEPLMQILNEICWSANLRYRQEDDVYILYKPD